MQDHPKKVKAAFFEQYDEGTGLSSGQRLNLQLEVAKDLLNEKYPDLIDELNQKAKDENAAELAEWKLILEDISLAGDVAQYVLFFLVFRPR